MNCDVGEQRVNAPSFVVRVRLGFTGVRKTKIRTLRENGVHPQSGRWRGVIVVGVTFDSFAMLTHFCQFVFRRGSLAGVLLGAWVFAVIAGWINEAPLGVLKFFLVKKGVLLLLTASRRGGERGFCYNTLSLCAVVVAFRVAGEGVCLRLVSLVQQS